MSSRVLFSPLLFSFLLLTVGPAAAAGQGPPTSPFDVSSLPTLTAGSTAAENGLWIENPIDRRFHSSRRVVVADIRGPAVITMIHFAMPNSHFADPRVRLGRDLLLKIYWDGETAPSVDCPLVDFFCDPAGTREALENALVNRRRGYNAYFPMPFRKSARVELLYDGPVEPGDGLWRIMPCYSYVMYRKVASVPAADGYFHAHWRQRALLLGAEDYLALQAKGKGKFIGWNVTIRSPGRSGYPVDANEKFFIDGADTPAIELQGLEDSFGFSWGFPSSENLFALTGYFPYFKGAAAYRFFIQDAISFDKSLRVAIGFGEHEHPMFRQQFSKLGSELQLSSVVYWYQREPHAPLPPMPSAVKRKPAPEDRFWLHPEKLQSAAALRRRGVRLQMRCGRPGREVVFAEKGYGATCSKGYAYADWNPPVYHCRASKEEVVVDITLPAGARGTLRIYAIDPDRFQGGRKEELLAGGRSLGTLEHFEQGRWIECAVSSDSTAAGHLRVRARNARTGSNAVISVIEWVEGPR